jgi:hypothetical protein
MTEGNCSIIHQAHPSSNDLGRVTCPPSSPGLRGLATDPEILCSHPHHLVGQTNKRHERKR